MIIRRSIAWLLFAVGGLSAIAAELPDRVAGPLYFRSIEAAVQSAGQFLAAQDWATLSRYYDLALTPEVQRTQLLDGSFFVDAAKSPNGPGAITRWLQPFPPGAKFAGARALGDSSHLPCIWEVSTVLSIDQGSGPVQRVVQEFHVMQTGDGFQFLPRATTERPAAPNRVTLRQWQAQGADPILLYRPQLSQQAQAEVPAGRSSNIPLLVQSLDRLKPCAAAHRGRTQAGARPWEPATVYEPTDDELLVSLAGDRVWRSLQLAPPGILTKVYLDNPSFTAAAIEYPHIEIVRVEVAGTGGCLYAMPPVLRRVNLLVP